MCIRDRSRAAHKVEQSVSAMPSNSLRDSVQAKTSVPSATLPEMASVQTFRNKSTTDTPPLPRAWPVPNNEKQKAARELSAKEQKESSLDEMYERWNKWEDEEYATSTALYNEKGEVLKKFKGEDS